MYPCECFTRLSLSRIISDKKRKEMATSEILNTEQRRQPLQPQQPEGSPKKGHGWIWLLVILALAGGGYYSWHSRSAATPGAADDQGGQPAGRGRGGRGGAGGPVSVGVVPVLKQDVPFYLTGLGSVTASYTVTVHSRVDGQLMKVYFQEGQFVHAGDALAEIDPRPYQVALSQAEGQLAKDQAAQTDAKTNLARYQQLYDSGVIPKQQLDSQGATVGQFDGSIQADKAQIDNAKLQITYAHITSPIDGRVGLRLVDPGNIVKASDPNGMLVITQLTPIAVVFTLPEDNLPQVVSDMRNGKLKVEAYSRDNDEKLAGGILETVDNQIDQTTGTVKLKAMFENKNLSLWPNQFVNTRLYLNVREGAIVVPTATIQTGTQGSFVYVVGQDSKAQMRPVQVDFNEANFTVIKQGLQAGEQVVFDGQDKLQPGSQVTTHPTNLNTGVPGLVPAATNAPGTGGGRGRGNRGGNGGANGGNGFSGNGQQGSGSFSSANAAGAGQGGGQGAHRGNWN